MPSASATGIYGRPGRSAPTPLNAHTRAFQSAAAAEAAGFCASLRSRPHRMRLVDGGAVPDVVARAVHLILDGALDQGLEASVARQVGVSGRHLRRLFADHLGVTPSVLAASARAHFARRLLDDTDLTVTEIAYVVGFGSVRQFNRVMLDVFHEKPQRLRERRQKADRLVADGGLVLHVPVTGSFDWANALRLLAQCAAPGVEHVTSGVYRRVILVQGSVGVVELLPADTSDHVVVKLHLPYWRDLPHVVRRVRLSLHLDSDGVVANNELGIDPLLAEPTRRRPELRPIGAWNSYEAGVKSIVGVPSDPGSAPRLRSILERTDTAVPGLSQLGLDRRFPSPDSLSGAAGSLPLPPALRRAIASFSAAVMEGSIAIDMHQPMHVRIRSFSSLNGVTADMVERFAWLVGDSSACPYGPRTRASLERLLPGAGSLREFHAHRERWYPHGATAFSQIALAAEDSTP